MAGIKEIVGVLSTVVNALPLQHDDKSNIDAILSKLIKATDPKVTVKKSDVESAVKAVLPDMVEKVVAAALASKTNA